MCLIRSFKTPMLLPLSCVQYAGQDTSLSAAPLQETEMEPSKLPLPFSRVGNHQLFTTQCDRSCPASSLLLPSSSSHIYTAIIIHRLTHHVTSILLDPLSHLSTTSLLLVSQSPRISAAVYAVNPYPQLLSYSVSYSAVLVNLHLP